MIVDLRAYHVLSPPIVLRREATSIAGTSSRSTQIGERFVSSCLVMRLNPGFGFTCFPAGPRSWRKVASSMLTTCTSSNLNLTCCA